MNIRQTSLKGILFIYISLFILLVSCVQGRKQDTIDKDSISEIEQLKYENALKQLESIYTEAEEAASTGNSYKESNIRQEIRVLRYTFADENMGENARKKCQELKERIETLKNNPDLAFHQKKISSANKENLQEIKSTILSRKNLKIQGIQRYPFWLNTNDVVYIKLNSQNSLRVSFYDIDGKVRIQQWTVNSTLSDSIIINQSGIYMIEIFPLGKEVYVDINLSYSGTDRTHRRYIQEKIIECSKDDFLATRTDSLTITNIFPEPKKIGLRGNLKTMFSGKSRAIIPIPIPADCDLLLYSLRISTNERTISSDGKFTEQLTVCSKRVKLMGVNIYEKQSSRVNLIDKLLFNTRPARDDEAFCNMYVFTSSSQAKKFQDETASSGNYKYDVNQSQMGTQSCNGQIKPNGNKVIYVGFENERMRYDNFIWFEAASLKFSEKYVRPIYLAK